MGDDRTAVARIAALLDSDGEPDRTLGEAARALRASTGAERVEIWRHEPEAPGFYLVSDPESEAPEMIASLDFVPRGGTQVVLRPGGGEALGLLRVSGGTGADLETIAHLLSIYLAGVRIGESRDARSVEQDRIVDEARRFTALIIDSLPVGLYVVDRDYRIQIWNRKRETGTQGLSRSQVVGRTVFEVLTRQPEEALRAEFDAIFETGELRQTDMQVDTPEGMHTYRLTRLPMRLGGDAITHVMTIGEDVSEWREVQGRILQSEKLAALGQLAAGVMHEINNPLATIAACVAAGEGRLSEVSGAGTGPLREYLAIIDKEVQRCTNIVDGLLDFSRPKAREKAPANLNDIVDEALGLLRHHKRFKQIALHREQEPELPPVVVNREQIIQVLMALTINSIDAMESGGHLTIRTMTGRRRMDEVIVEVEDTGPGIPGTVQSKIFEPFFTTKAPGRGTGLGLSICYGIVEEHRGRIEVDSQLGRGATFRVHLPIDFDAMMADVPGAAR
ncbi:MAG TPA: ATP-binding protein [Gemmatimonadales bacterium]|nr:ATP-binding protein [Gemmatimonadales bacterium]